MNQPPYQPPPPNQPHQPQQPYYQQPPKKNSNLGLILTIVGAAVLLCVILPMVLFFATCNKMGKAINEGLTKPMANYDHLTYIRNATNLYMADHDDRFPLAHAWVDGLEPYSTDRPQAFTSPFAPHGEHGYAMNAALSGLSFSQLTYPDETAYIFNTGTFQRNASGGIHMLMEPPDEYISLDILTAGGDMVSYDMETGPPDIFWEAQPK